MAVTGFIWLLWLFWLAVWMALARGVKPVARSESASARLTYLLLVALAVYLLVAPRVPSPWLNERFAPFVPWLLWLGAALTFAGIAFSIWARLLLAGNWSASVTLKHDHELVVAGPYHCVRHPIYTGLLVALAGTALALGEWRGLIALAITAAALWRKLRLEEALMRGQFGDAYARYAERVPALIPFVL
jgi:protein-S-isoprenylcysteine O-methyltransferase Ste14